MGEPKIRPVAGSMPFSSRRLVEIDGILLGLKAELAGTFGINVDFLELERDAIRRHIGMWFIGRAEKERE